MSTEAKTSLAIPLKNIERCRDTARHDNKRGSAIMSRDTRRDIRVAARIERFRFLFADTRRFSFVTANHSIMRPDAMLGVADCVVDCIRLAVQQATEWQRIGD
jgi:hypothetical protein